MSLYVLNFDQLSLNDVNIVGGKNASLGQMFRQLSKNGIMVPDGFATTSATYREFLKFNKIETSLRKVLSKLDTSEFSNLEKIGKEARDIISDGVFPEFIAEKIINYYRQLCQKYGKQIDVAVRSSATAEDLPDASFAGQHDSYLNISGEESLLEACLNCYASLFTDRAIKYRHDHGYDHLKVSLSIGVQKMVRSDKASSGVCFTIEPESGFSNVVYITGTWGLGENIVQGAIIPDEFFVFKPTLLSGFNAIINKKLGSKSKTMIYAENGARVKNIDTPGEKCEQFVLNESEVEKIAHWAIIIENHYGRPMDIEWAKDGDTGEIYIVQARPETIHGKNKHLLAIKQFKIKDQGRKIVNGKGIGNKIISGVARILNNPGEIDLIKPGEVLVTEITNPDWDPILKKAAAIVTNRGGRTSHAAIVAREMGAVAVVGTSNATELIKDGEWVTVSCEDGINGIVYEGKLNWSEETIDFTNVEMPSTEAKLILADPDKAFNLSFYPNNGVGLLRMEFIISNIIQIHPMAFVKPDQIQDAEVIEKINYLTRNYSDKKEYFIEKLSQGIATIAAAFYPKEVIVRMSDFKTNEYSNLIGGKTFEPVEENPMLGFRGASRYYNPRYKQGFALECAAMKVVREKMGFKNVKLMIPFCRTVDEGVQVLKTMEGFGLKRGSNGLEVYMMVEIPSNVILANEFGKIFDGFSIGSNDLTQLTLGIDRDSSTVSDLFNERNDAVKSMIAQVIDSAKKSEIPIGLCGQAPSDYPDFAEFLITKGISSISFNPDALLNGINHMVYAEKQNHKILKD